MSRWLNSFLIIALLLSCSKEPSPGGTPSNDNSINGTELAEGINACGLIKDSSTGQGIPGVPVTDGYSYTVTDKNGVYQMVANRYCRNIYYSLPAGYKVTLDSETHLPAFYSTITFDHKKLNRNDFELTPDDSMSDEFTYVAIGDPQVTNISHVNRYINETLADLKSTLKASQASGKYKNVIACTMGDIVHDTPNMWTAMKSAMSGLEDSNGYFPIFQSIGNHDHDAKERTQYAAVANYISHFGPTDYSLNVGNVHIVTLESVICKSTTGKTWSYNGGFTATQLKWLKEDLSHVDNKESKLIILNLHIPFREGKVSGGGLINKDKYYDDVLRLLTEFHEAHIMSGHRHFPQNWVHSDYVCRGGMPIYEHIHAAACGCFWNCHSNLDGSPNAYSIYEVKGNCIVNWFEKAVGHDIDFQMRVYDGNQVYAGTKGYEYTWYNGGIGGTSNIKAKGYSALKGCFVAELWNDDDVNWRVEFYQNGSKVADLKRVPNGQCSNACSSSYFFNELNKNAGDYAISENCHYWYYKPESGYPSAEQNWEIRATQTIPSSGLKNVYSVTSLKKDYEGF